MSLDYRLIKSNLFFINNITTMLFIKPDSKSHIMKGVR